MRRLWAIDLGGQAGRGIAIDPRAPGGDGLRADFQQGLPIRDSSVDIIYAYHVLEHVEDLLAFIEELWRVCKPNALVYAWVPHASSPYTQWADPTHKRGFLIETFSFFGTYKPARFDVEATRLHFSTRKRPGRARPLRLFLSTMLEALANRSRSAQYRCERWWGHWLGFEEALVVLRAVKDDPRRLAHVAKAQARD